MKTHKDLLKAQAEFIQKRDSFLSINAAFFLNLINQVYGKGEIPAGDLIKYRNGTNDNINIPEEWLNLEDDGSCTMRIAILSNGVSQIINFKTVKEDNSFTLNVQIDRELDSFSYDISKQSIENIDFTNVVNYIFETLEKSYTSWKF